MSRNLRQIPAIHELLQSAAFGPVVERYGREAVVESLRQVLDGLRSRGQLGVDISEDLSGEKLASEVQCHLGKITKASLRPVINATGIFLHTNLGRAPMAPEAVEAAAMAARGYLNLEVDLNTGRRSHRPDHVRPLITRLLGCESATVVNNNAAATVIVLRALAQGREVIVSRGELVEIGGSFRIPEIMAASGACLVEVGSTNITRLSDYARAISDRTALLMRIHTSNYRIVGHAQKPSIHDLVQLGRERGILLADDLGSGALVNTAQWGLQQETLPQASLKTGSDLILFSGDKLLGGPQCGIIAGREVLIRQIERDPLMRAFRVDKMTLASLEATLRLYFQPEKALAAIPHFRMLETPLAALQERAYLMARCLGSVPGLQANVIETKAFVGGGALPDEAIVSVALAISSEKCSEHELARRLRQSEPALMGRVENEKVVLDLRTVLPEQNQELIDVVLRVCSNAETTD